MEYHFSCIWSLTCSVCPERINSVLFIQDIPQDISLILQNNQNKAVFPVKWMQVAFLLAVMSAESVTGAALSFGLLPD